MAGYVIIGALAAFGLLSAVWAALGWLLPGEKGGVLVYFGDPPQGSLLRCRWLQSLGLLRCGVLVVEPNDCAVRGEAEICSREELLPRLELERKRYDGTGNGDHPGRDQRCGISEL